MSTLETILSRMMNEPAFASAVFTDTENALAEYKLSAEEIAKFKGITRADFEALTSHAPEERKSLATKMGAPSGRLYVATDQGVF
jgi:hypothetical protein